MISFKFLINEGSTETTFHLHKSTFSFNFNFSLVIKFHAVHEGNRTEIIAFMSEIEIIKTQHRIN